MTQKPKLCLKCGSTNFVKNGRLRGLQRYRCKTCKYNFTTDKRRGKSPAMKALAVLMYAMGKSSFDWIGDLLGVSGVAVYKWIKQIGNMVSMPKIGEIKEIEFDEMWHFVQSKKTKDGYGKRWIVLEGKPSPGLLAIVMLKPLRDFGRK